MTELQFTRRVSLAGLLLLAACGMTANGDAAEADEASIATASLPPIAADAPTRFPVEVDSLWGYIDAEGQMAIPPRFARAGRFSEGLAAVVPAGGEAIGFIDASGSMVIEPRFHSTSYSGLPEFAQGLAAVRLQDGGPYGYIDPSGTMVIEPRFASRADTDPRRFNEGLVAAREVGSDRFGFIDQAGDWVIEPQFSGAGSFGGGLAPVRSEGWSYSYIDRSGEVVLEGPYESAGRFSEGLAPVEPQDGNGYVYIDDQGQIVLRPVFPESLPDRAGSFSEGLAAVHYDGADYWRYVDKSGEPAEYTRPEKYKWFDDAEPFRGGLARVTIQDAESAVYIDRDGNVVWSPETAVSSSAQQAAGPDRSAPRGEPTCSTRECFEQAFAACEPASYVAREAFGRARYEILEPASAGCRASLVYTSNPNPSWVGKELRFTLDNERPFRDAVQAGLNACLGGADHCDGPLAELFAGSESA